MDSNTFLICTAIVSFAMIAIGILGLINEYQKQKAGTSKTGEAPLWAQVFWFLIFAAFIVFVIFYPGSGGPIYTPWGRVG